MEFENVIRERTAVRKFSNKGVEKEKIDKILEAGRLAPTALNKQPFKILVVQNELDKIDKASRCRYNAPVVLVVCASKDDAYQKGEYSTYEMDASIVATHMMLEATNLGVDNIWIELFDGEILKEEFNLNNLEPICLLPIGYKADDCPVNSMHNVRKPIDDLVEWR